MKIYFAGSADNSIWVERNALRLGTYVSARGELYDYWTKSGDTPVFVDSGAFSAYTRGIDVNIEEYARFCSENAHRIEHYANLDVVGDWRDTAYNQRRMEEMGMAPLPVFHYGAPMSELSRLCERYDYIGFGGPVPYAMQPKTLSRWLDMCFAEVSKYRQGNRVKRVHGFGVNSVWAWKRYPFYSVDATSWLTGGRYRRVVRFNGSDLVPYSKKSGASVDTVRCHNEDYQELNRQNMAEYQKMADHVTKLWSVRGVDFVNN